jgi:hypothetical protein
MLIFLKSSAIRSAILHQILTFQVEGAGFGPRLLQPGMWLLMTSLRGHAKPL